MGMACTLFQKTPSLVFLMGLGWVMERRKFTREFKLEAVRLQGPQTNNGTGAATKEALPGDLTGLPRWMMP